MKDCPEELYGPCDPMLPSDSQEHTWTMDIKEGYRRKDNNNSEVSGEVAVATDATTVEAEEQVETLAPSCGVPLRVVRPAWEGIGDGRREEHRVRTESISGKESGRGTTATLDPELEAPCALDHLFLLRGGPGPYLQRSLFEKDERFE